MTDALMSVQNERAIASLLHRYAEVLDSDLLEQWPDLFAEDGVYKVWPRENALRGLPLALMLCEGRDSMWDRIRSLREANIYNEHFPRHLVSNIRLIGESAGVFEVSSAYVVYQTDLNGRTQLFSVGQYQDRISISQGVAKFLARTVLCDSFAVPTLLAIPL